jgi:lysophospholipase L1-like esterase
MLVVSSLLSLVVIEILLRKIDGYPLLPVTLGAIPQPQKVLTSQNSLRDYLKKIPLPDDIDTDWFMLNPQPLPPKPADPFLSFLMNKAKGTEAYSLGNVMKQINRNFLLNEIQHKGAFYESFIRFPKETVVFEPCENNSHPVYRFPPNVTMPGGLVTNNFGWRGCDIDLNKPPHTIRLCFVGASTTIGLHSLRCSYPEYIGAWLNIWSQKNKWNIKFEIINAAREGVRSSDIAAIFRQEVLPLEPDFAIYYEGANQFEYRSLIKNLDSIPSPAQYENQGFLYPLTALEGYSATARRVSELFLKITRTGYGKEPLKPGYVLNTSGGIDTDEPDVSRPDLALNLSAVLRDLESIHQQAHKINCQFYLLSFVWLPYDGMVLDPARHKSIFNYINKFHWPLRYSDFKRLSDFQNAVFKTYASKHDIHFIDLSGSFPRDPDLFIDAVHFNEKGTRLQAWIVLQGLIPEIRKRIERGELPASDREYLNEHPCIRPGIRNGFAEILEK